MLDPSQALVKEDILENIETYNKVLINGSAGTGKTYLAASIINDFAEDNKRIIVTAPTHQALNVLKTKILHLCNDDNLPFSSSVEDKIVFETIHAALQMKRVVGNDGKIYFARDRFAKSVKPIYDGFYYLLVIDEASMLEASLLKHIDSLEDVFVIFLGDEKQINPVGESVSKVFSMGYKTFTLTVPQRQSEGCPILDISLNPHKLALRQKSLIGGKGYVFNNDIDNLTTKMAQAPENIIYLGWTNKTVNAVNKLVRQKIYKTTTPNRFELKEEVIFDRPYKDFTNRQKIRINTLKVVDYTLNVPGTFSSIDRKGRILNPDEKKFKCYIINGSIVVLHEDSLMEYFELSEQIKVRCQDGDCNWKLYYYFIEQVASLKYAYAMTVHVSQGSTFYATIVDVGNIYQNPDRGEAKRLLYTAITRSSNITIFYNT